MAAGARSTRRGAATGAFLRGSPEGEATDELREKWHHLLIDEKPQVRGEIGYPLAVGRYEVTARAGTATARHWGDAIGEGMAACDGCGGRWNGRSTAPVGSFPTNAFGLHDMLGNAYEWVSDCYVRGNDVGPTDGAPLLDGSPYWEHGTCTVHVRRGGSWASPAWHARSANRRPVNTKGPWGLAGDRYAGFRAVRELKPRHVIP